MDILQSFWDLVDVIIRAYKANRAATGTALVITATVVLGEVNT